MTLSTNESELSAQTECGRDLYHFRLLTAELLQVDWGSPSEMRCDSAGAIAVAERRVATHRTKHIRLRDKWVRQLVSRGHAVMKYVASALLDADACTKALAGPAFKLARQSLLLHDSADMGRLRV